MNPLLSETLLSLTDLAKRCPSGRGTGPSRTAHRTTVLRWVKKGVRAGAGRVKLEAVRVGERLMTSEEAYARFVTACNAASGIEPAAQSPAEFKREAKRAGKELEAMFARTR